MRSPTDWKISQGLAKRRWGEISEATASQARWTRSRRRLAVSEAERTFYLERGRFGRWRNAARSDRVCARQRDHVRRLGVESARGWFLAHSGRYGSGEASDLEVA